MSRRFRLFLIAVSVIMLGLASLACESEEWEHSDNKGDLTVEQENALLKVVKFSVDGDVPEGKEVALVLDETIIGRLSSDGRLSLSLDADQRSGVTVRIRDEGTEDEWVKVASVGLLKPLATARIEFDGIDAKVWLSAEN